MHNRMTRVLVMLIGMVVVAGVVEAAGPLQFYAITPCRLVDTRQAVSASFPSGYGQPALVNSGHPSVGPFRSITVSEARCGIPVSARAIVANFTVTGTQASGFIKAWATGDAVPNVANLNFGLGETVGNGSVVPLDVQTRMDVAAFGLGLAQGATATHVIIDITGYFQ